MSDLRCKSKDDNSSLKEYEHALRRHFEANKPDTSGIDFRAMAKKAIQMDATLGGVPAVRQRHKVYILLQRAALTACVCLIVAGIGRFSFYFAPNWQQMTYAAVRQIPNLQFVIPKWDIGLLHRSSDIESMNVSASNRGASIYVTAAYADTARTVIFLRTSGTNVGMGFLRPETFTLTDQYGHQYSEVPPIGTSSVQPNGSWVGSLDFEGIANWKQVTGLRLKLTVTSMLWSSTKNNSTHTVHGLWTMKWVQPTTPVGQPHSVTIDQVSSNIPVRLTQVQLAPSATVFDIQASGASIEGTNSKSPIFGFVERVSDGKKFDLLGGAEPNKIVTVPLTTPGKYMLVVTNFDGKNVRWELSFTVFS